MTRLLNTGSSASLTRSLNTLLTVPLTYAPLYSLVTFLLLYTVFGQKEALYAYVRSPHPGHTFCILTASLNIRFYSEK